MSSVGPKGQETPRGTFFKLIAYFIIFSNINSEKINSCSVYAIQILWNIVHKLQYYFKFAPAVGFKWQFWPGHTAVYGTFYVGFKANSMRTLVRAQCS